MMSPRNAILVLAGLSLLAVLTLVVTVGGRWQDEAAMVDWCRANDVKVRVRSTSLDVILDVPDAGSPDFSDRAYRLACERSYAERQTD
jgi:hypothetical protein